MNRILFYILAFCSLWACTKESHLTLSSNSASKAYIPNFKKEKLYRNNLGDTITLRKISSANYYEHSPSEGGNMGSLGSFDYIEVERTKLTVGSDTPYYRIHYDLTTRYDASRITHSRDALTITLDEENNPGVATMELIYTDSLNCVSARCSLQDTLKLQLNTFFDVYFLARDSLHSPSIYLNKTKGLAGFRTSNNQIFELISR